MSAKRLFLWGLTAITLFLVVLALVSSIGKPQVQARLQLYQTNLQLQASQWSVMSTDAFTVPYPKLLMKVQVALVGEHPYQKAQNQYLQARQISQKQRSRLQSRLESLGDRSSVSGSDASPDGVTTSDVSTTAPISPFQQQLQLSLAEFDDFLAELDLKLGIIQVVQKQPEIALATWGELHRQGQETPTLMATGETAAMLIQLWGQAPLSKEIEAQINAELTGWFRYQSLQQLYQRQERSTALNALQAQEQPLAAHALWKLGVINLVPVVGIVLGIGLGLFLLIERLWKKERSLVVVGQELAWETPWNGDVILQVMVVGFFFVSFLVTQFTVPLVLSLAGVNPAQLSVRAQAIAIFCNYGLMAAGGLTVLWISIKRFFPLPADWFVFRANLRCLSWGIGGYAIAIPTVLFISVINQQIWQGQGGSNDLLMLALKAQDTVALALFFLTAAVAAPIFEEVIFRGFLLPSLTRYLGVWHAIGLSGLIFAIAHLSLAEVLPLTMLGVILGFVYVRSRNLLASMLVHSLWNSGTLLSLFLLGSSID